MNFVDNKLINALLGILTFFVSYISQHLLEYFTAINMDNILLDLGTFVLIYVIVYFLTKMLVYKYKENWFHQKS